MKEKKDPIISIKNVSKFYEKRGVLSHALKNVSLDVYPGDIVGVIGLSGAGKSTLLRSIARLCMPDRGSICFHETDIGQLKGQGLRNYQKKIGMIFQHFHLLNSRNVAKNVAYPLEISKRSKIEIKERVEEMLRLVGLYEKRESYSFELSGGEKQRVGIARALARNPEILLCDEATSALDPRTTKGILTLLKAIHKKYGITMILITHQMEVVKQICHRIAVIDKGKIVEENSAEEIFFHPKHPITKKFLQVSNHDLPDRFLKESDPNKRLILLRFKGRAASEPIISEIVRKCGVNINILLGWIDPVGSTLIGTLIIELEGSIENIEKALLYLHQKQILYERIHR